MRIHAFHHLYQRRIERATKPFAARGSKVARCQYCQIAQQECLCAYQPDVNSRLAVMLILADNEILKPSNTGRLILDAVKEGYAYQWHRTEPDAQMLAVLQNPKYQPILVFPEQYVSQRSRLLDAAALTGNTANAAEQKTPLLIFLDGSWREARRMFNKSPYLATLPVLSITPESVSQYQLRHSENEHHLATAEVASLVFAELGEQQLAQILSDWFGVFRESYLNSKTRLKPDKARPALQRFIAQRNSNH